MDFLSNLFGLNESKAVSASNGTVSSGSVSSGTLAKLNTPAPQLGGRRIAKHKRTAKNQRTHKSRTHKRKHN